uniref:Uncharacterized protein n=1 Tax=Tanacetum cinerariifolium TaxID=118510 RepID=A0A699HFS3_TANCI|nr:hypothetical protein [Tanacetum cinerariifolium]
MEDNEDVKDDYDDVVDVDENDEVKKKFVFDKEEQDQAKPKVMASETNSGRLLKVVWWQLMGTNVKACIWFRIGMSMLASKGNVPDVQKKDMAPHLLHQSKDLATMILLSKTAAGVALSGYEELVIRSRDITFVDSIYRARSAINSSSLTKPIQKSQVVLIDIPKNLDENNIIVAEHGLSSKITQSPSGSSDTSEGSENSRSFKDSGRSNEEYSEDEASSKDEGSETPQVGDEREVEVLRSFNWPPGELITDDGVSPVRVEWWWWSSKAVVEQSRVSGVAVEQWRWSSRAVVVSPKSENKYDIYKDM